MWADRGSGMIIAKLLCRERRCAIVTDSITRTGSIHKWKVVREDSGNASRTEEKKEE